MTPTKIVLEKTASHLQLRVFAQPTQHGSFVRESVGFANGVAPKPQTLALLRKDGARYAKKFSIPFVDQTA
jgi:hypothetical protein